MYKITKAKPFVIEGEHGTYEIPVIKELDFNQLTEVVLIQDESDFKKRWGKIKKYLLKMAPGLESEDLSDSAYVHIYQAYENESNRPTAEAGESSAS